MRLTRLSKLEVLNVSRNPKLTNRGIEFLLKQNQQLDQLQMHSEPEGGVYDPSCIVHAPKLSRLMISAAQLNDSAFAVVAKHPTLSWLAVEFATNRDELLMDQVVALIVQRKQLTQVNLAGYGDSALNLIKARVDELRSKRPDIKLTIANGGDYLKVYEAEDSIDRRAAKWALGIGGTVVVLALPDLQLPANARSITSADQLPTGYFEVIGVELDANQKVDDAGLANLAGLPGIKLLSLRNTMVSDAGLQHLASLSSMQTLLLSNTTVSDAGLKYLKGMQKLETLFLYGTQITDAGAETLAQLPSLYMLHVSSTRMTAEGLAKLQGIKNLRELGLAGTKISDADLEILRRFTELKSLNVTDLGVSDTTLAHIGNLEHLEVLVVGLSDRLTDDGLKHLANLNRLNIVSFAYTNIGDDGLEHLAKLPLKHLDVTGTQVSAAGIARLLETHPHLESLNAGQTEIGDEGLRSIGKMKLTQLAIDQVKLTDAGLAHLTELDTLETLMLHSNPITDEGLPHLAKLTRLRTLNLTNTKVTATGVAALHEALPECRITYGPGDSLIIVE